jgi:tetratricopeptide (TPR) repeat protein
MRRNRLVLVGFCAVLAFAWFCYQPAISGAFQLDDYVNLGGLAKVQDARSAIDFISSGIAGPTGRPLALASFALQADEWHQGPSALLRVNILIHLANAILLAVSLYQLSLRRSVARIEATLVATVAASLWVLMPLLATASLLVVQRMATLSAMFMLLGLCGYLFARARIESKPKRALLGMSVSVVTGTVLATLCKESGLLLPVLVLILETTVLERPGSVKDRDWRTWQLIFLVAPLALLLAYLATWLNYSEAVVAQRGFTAWERLLTEARVLWIYLAKAAVGIPSQLGVFQYPPSVSRSLFNPATLVACIVWLSLLTASIAWRRRYPLFAVSVLWYLAGHAIESTVVPLELYFEHRNYMPIIGPLFGLASFLVLSPARRSLVPRALVLVLALVNAWFLYSFSVLSGQPSIAARYWADIYPESTRAVTSVAMYRLEEEGLLPALQTIESFVTEKPEYGYMRLLQLNLLCQYAPKQDQRWVLDRLERDLPAVDYLRTAPGMLFDLLNTSSRTSCRAVDAETVATLATVLRGNPRYENEPLFNRSYHVLLADIAHRRGRYKEEIDHLRRALTHWPTSNLNEKMVRAMIDADDFDRARKFINESRDLAPANPIMAMRWQRDLDALHDYVGEIEHEHDVLPAEQMGGDKSQP